MAPAASLDEAVDTGTDSTLFVDARDWICEVGTLTAGGAENEAVLCDWARVAVVEGAASVETADVVETCDTRLLCELSEDCARLSLLWLVEAGNLLAVLLVTLGVMASTFAEGAVGGNVVPVAASGKAVAFAGGEVADEDGTVT